MFSCNASFPTLVTKMSSEELTQSELEAYLDEALDPERAAWLEQKLRENPDLVQRLSTINARRDAGLHTLGEIWRRYQIGVPEREQLASYIAGTLADEEMDYIRYRIEILKCPFTIANLQDLQEQQAEAGEIIDERRARYFKLSDRLSDE